MNNETVYEFDSELDLTEISNRDQLVRYIRLMLGEPLIQVELTNDHIIPIISDAVKTYTDVVYGFFEDVKVVIAESSIRLREWDEVTRVTSVDGRTDFNFKWDSIKRSLLIIDDRVKFRDPTSLAYSSCNDSQYHNPSRVMIIGQARYQVDPEFDLIYNESWIKEFAKAKTQLLWGQVLGKYSQSLVGGATINYDRLISEAQSDIERLMEELHEKWMDPAPVLVG